MMSEQKLVSPLLDGFQMGDPISSHDGVRCCPAIKENSDNKYIIKILSIPASQNQLEALLLTGAFQDAAGALNYFRELADGVVREAQLHQQLARLKGFVPCEGWQVVPMDDNQLGYDVYLLTPYRRTLERYLKKNTMTHLEAVNLGLDLCAALAACRRAGYIHVDLKPSNIFISDDKEYLIGDLGFISMDSMKYAALPSKYRSRYSAPELHDMFATISATSDIYALGLILYQVYNDGKLPFDIQPPAEELPPPANADYEMAEIILKACHPDPSQRWQDPAEMGQALVAYMQRNTINDVPIIPPVIPEVSEELPAEEDTQEPIAAEAPVAAENAAVEEIPDEAQEAPAEAEEIPAEAEEAPAEAEEIPAEAEEAPAEAEEIPDEEQELPDADAEDPLPAEADIQASAEPVPDEEIPAAEVSEESGAQAPAEAPDAVEEPAGEEEADAEEVPAADEIPADAAPADPAEPETDPEQEDAVTAETTEDDLLTSVAQELASVYEMISDETIPDEADVQDLENAQVSEETSAMLAQAEALAAMEIPEGVVVPEPKLPEAEPAAETLPEFMPDAFPEELDDEEDEDEDDGSDDEIDIPITLPDLEPVKKKSKKWLLFIAIIALLAGLAYGACYYYQNYYLIPVASITLDGSTDQITADIDVALDESILTAVCTDTYGNTVTSSVVDGKAAFEGLKPGMQYTVSLKVDGFYKLTGNNTASFTTFRQTNIVSISATTGAEDGSVILSFTVDGTDPENWTVEYTAEGEEPQSLSFTGHMVTITGLTLDSTYTFRLMPSEATDVDVVGNDTLEFTAGKVILAENTAIDSFKDDVMTIRWNAPEGTQVSEWTIRCTNADGYDETLTVTDCTASFSGICADTTYSLEILAQGMTQSARADVTPKLLTVSAISCTPVDPATLRITWEYEGDPPASGWTVTCAMNGGETQTLTSETNAADLSPVIPGASYTVSVNGVETTYTAPAAGKFSDHGISADDLSYSFCIAPAASGWNANGVKYTANFSAGQPIGLVIYSNSNVRADSADVQILYLIRDEQGNLLPDLTAVQSMNWADMWQNRAFCTSLPNQPDALGLYTLEIYFDGDLAVSKNFRIE